VIINKPVILKLKQIKNIERDNPNLTKEEITLIIASSLYNPSSVGRAKKSETEQDMYNFIAKNINKNQNSLSMVKLSEHKRFFEIRDIGWISNKSVKQKEKHSEEIIKEKG
jgi:predicted adenine nucleotide alpha hydrolase (AANH) superfamily ATPase